MSVGVSSLSLTGSWKQGGRGRPGSADVTMGLEYEV